MNLFNFAPEELLSFFAILVRFSVLITVLPITGDRFVPAPAKVLFSLAVTLALFPALVARGEVNPGEAIVWGATPGGILGTVTLEALFGFVLGYTGKLCFDAIHFGSNLAGNFMGFAMASQYDPHQESQSQVVAEIQMAIAMLMFLALDGHHLMLRAALESYQIVGLGKASFGAVFSQKLIDLTGQVILFGMQIAAPVAVSIFAVNMAFGVMAKAVPSLNIFALSMTVTSLVGLVVMFLSVPHFGSACGVIFERMGDWMHIMMNAMVNRG